MYFVIMRIKDSIQCTYIRKTACPDTVSRKKFPRTHNSRNLKSCPSEIPEYRYRDVRTTGLYSGFPKVVRYMVEHQPYSIEKCEREQVYGFTCFHVYVYCVYAHVCAIVSVLQQRLGIPNLAFPNGKSGDVLCRVA